MSWWGRGLEVLLSPWLDPDAEGRAFDTRYGTETRWFDLGNYEPTPPSAVRDALAALPVPAAGRTFVDLGSGKGRVVLLASRHGFDAVVGIEHRPRLHGIALRNQAAFERVEGAGSPAHFFCGDVVDHPLPDGPLVIWMFNPFGAEVVDLVFDRLRDRDVHVIYAWPKHVLVLQAHGFRPQVLGGTDDCPWRILAR